MFIHNFKYALKQMIRNKSAIVWTLIFPLALGSIMFVAFGNIYNSDNVFHTLNVAVVKTEENENFETLLEELSKSEGDKEAILDVSYLAKDEAETGALNGDYDAVIYEGTDITLGVTKSDIQQEIVRSIVEQYNKSMHLIEDAAAKDPTKIAAVIESISDYSAEYAKQDTTTDGNTDMYTNYFYAIIAMSCLFGSYAACEFSEKMSLSASELGKRRGVSRCSKGLQAISTFFAMWIIQVAVEIITIFYLKAIGVHLGDKILYMIPIVAAGTAVGNALGTLIGSVPKLSQGGKTGICTSISLGLCVMADLCASGVKDALEHAAPIVNRINPAALISDSFYALNVFDSYDRYIRSIVLLAVIAACMLFFSYLILRRDKGASI
ncbi:MAG: ABC transporter permease [Parasporobacterium sp.]|nr:ABC transporter permease [Parasporobacterium sp.]